MHAFLFSGKAYSGLHIVGCSQWFAPSCKPSVFTVVKLSLDCRPWQWQAYLSESVFDLVRWCEAAFLNQGKNSVILLGLFWRGQALIIGTGRWSELIEKQGESVGNDVQEMVKGTLKPRHLQLPSAPTEQDELLYGCTSVFPLFRNDCWFGHSWNSYLPYQFVLLYKPNNGFPDLHWRLFRHHI